MNFEQLYLLYDTLHTKELHNKTLPEWANVQNLNRMRELASLYFPISLGNEKLKRLKIGPFLGEIIKNMVEKAKDTLTPDRKLWIYSAHDETIANILMTLNVYDGLLPPYASAVLIELRETQQNERVVTVSYKKESNKATTLTIPSCATACPLDQFVELTKRFIPSDWTAECEITK